MLKFSGFFFVQLGIICIYNGPITSAEPLVGSSSLASRYETLFIVYIRILCLNCMENSTPPNHSLTDTCVGTVITKRHVLTLARCLDDKTLSQIQVLGGAGSLELLKVYSVNSWVTYKEWIRQNRQSGSKVSHDIAVIKLSENIDETKMKPAYLSFEENEKHYDKYAIIAGWRKLVVGAPENRREVQSLHTAVVKVMNRAECQMRKKELREEGALSEEIICTRSQPYSLLGCDDDGAPLLSKDDKSVIGIGTVNCLHNLPTLLYKARVNSHANLYYYKDFIVDATAGEKLTLKSENQI